MQSPNHPITQSPDVLVLGGGPAGCAAARLLALWGHGVILVSKPSSGGAPLAESIPPSTRKLFDLLDVGDAIDAAGFVRSTGNTVWWGSRIARVERFAADELGWQVTTDRLDSILLDAAVDAGVRVEIGRATADAASAHGATFILDCTGRSGVMARARGLRVHEPHQRTVALLGHWRRPTPFDLPDPTHTVIESYSAGWAWSVPDMEGHRYVAVMVDPRTSNLARDRGALEVYDAEIHKTERFRALLGDATLIEGLSGWDASQYSAVRYVDDDVLLVGDAGSFIDPLSSAGVKKALASGWLAAIAAHTSLVHSDMRETALGFFAAREAEVYASFKELTTRYLAEAAVGHAHPFWSDRTESGATDTSRAETDNQDRDVSTKAAFERIRQADELRLARAPALRVERQPAVSGCEIVLERRLVSDTWPEGLRYAFDVDLIPIVDLAPAHRQVPDLFAAYNRQHAPVDLPDFLAALATLVSRGWLVWKEDSS